MKKNDLSENLKLCFEQFFNFAKSSGSQFKQHYRIADSNIQISFSNECLYTLLSPAIVHLSSQASSLADLNIFVCEQASSNSVAPEISKTLREIELDYDHAKNSQPIFYFQSKHHQLSYQLKNGVSEVQILNYQKKQAIVWFKNLKELPIDTPDCLSAPFRTLFSWHFSQKEFVIIHAAGVGNTNGGAIFIGPGGSGKTNSSLACLKSGLKFAGDDSILINTGEEIPTAFSLYNSAKLRPSDLTFFNSLDSAICDLELESPEKARLMLAGNFSNSLIKSFPIKAIIAPTVMNGVQTKIQQIEASEAFKILAPSSLLHIPGQNQTTLHALAKLVKRLPCFRLWVGDRQEIGSRVVDLLKDL